ncbi:MAG: hypothetical protein WBE26_19580 [Phycisphaerae bacterium]
MDFWLTRELKSTLGPNYRVEMQVGNPSDAPFRFDSVRLDYPSSEDKDDPMRLTGQLVLFTEYGIAVYSEWGGIMKSTEEESLSPVNVPAKRSITFEFSITPTRRQNVPASVALTLRLGGNDVSGTYHASLPGMNGIPARGDTEETKQGYNLALKHVSP